MRKMRWLWACLMISAVTESARILSLLPIPVRSHYNQFHAILKALAERGHQVVSYTTFPETKPIANYTVIQISSTASKNNLLMQDLLQKMMSISRIGSDKIMWNHLSEYLHSFLKNDEVLKLFQSNEKYDLIILEPQIGQEALLGLGHKFNAPTVAVQLFGAFSLVNSMSGNSLSLSYIPDFAFPYSDRMSFRERFINSYSILATLYNYYNEHLPAQEELMRNLYNDPTMPPLVDMVHNISLFVTNAHPYVHYPQPYTPNMIPIGGIHLAEQQTPLPETMKIFMDEAKNGVIYFSLGSLVPDHDMPQQYYDNFLAVFRRLRQRVVWKTGAELSGLPDNVMTVKWAPQQDILAHPNTVLFMTHGGIFSQHEAINAGVPVVCTPFFVDQPMNARFYVEKGIGVELPFNSLSEETIFTAITEILSTPKYKDNMRRLSAIYRDRPVSPANSLVFWVEYVLRHRGAHHLRPASAAMAWYHLILLDVIGFFIFVIVTGFTLLFWLRKFLLK